MEVQLKGQKIGLSCWCIDGNKPVEIVFNGYIPDKEIVFYLKNETQERTKLDKYLAMTKDAFSKKVEAKEAIRENEYQLKLSSLKFLEAEVESLKKEIDGYNN